MYPVLIMREEIVCIIVLLFLLFMGKSYKLGKDRKAFNLLTVFALVHVVFDIITVYTVNNMDVVPSWINTGAHIVFYMAAILFSNEFCIYVLKTCYKNVPGYIYWIGYGLALAYLITVPFFGLEYKQVEGTYTSTGMLAYIGFAVAMVYFLVALVAILINFGKLDKLVKYSLIPMLVVLFLAEFMQVVVPSFLFTGGAITIVTVAFFFSLENPAHIFEKKAMVDALTGVRSRQSYDMDIKEIDKKFKKNPNSGYIFAFCDINNLKAINGIYGHSEGDRYITLVTQVFMEEFKHADGIYRMGGDEFFVVFHNVEEPTVTKECRAVQAKCLDLDPGKSYVPSVAIGYAVAGPEYKSVRDVVRTADYMMYKNKTEMKGAKSYVGDDAGTKLNLTGLTDSLFDAVCSSNDKMYPYITNLETEVTRISPRWKEEFGMPSEFVYDFHNIWEEHIHPEDRAFYHDDITAVKTGKQKYHSYDYRALNADGEYVFCSCHGSIYKGKNGEPDIFSGYMINRGTENRIDSVTGLRNYTALDEAMFETIRANESVYVMILTVNNLDRLNMFYEYGGGRTIMREVGQVLVHEINEGDEVFSNNGQDMSILLRNKSRDEVRELYLKISEILRHGVNVHDSIVPLDISGAAAEITPEENSDLAKIRRYLMFALDKSKYYKQSRLIFAEAVSDEQRESEFEFLSNVHNDAMFGADNFILRYQPVFDTQSGNIVGAEALIRWNSPIYGEVSPGRFIEFLETDACYYDLGIRIIRRAIQDAREMRKLIPDFIIGLNITAVQIRNDSFLKTVCDIAEDFGYPTGGILFELTERSKEMDVEFLKNRISEFREKGFNVAFDDMGSGYSTVDILLNIPVDEVKLDREFVAKLPEEESYQIFTEALSSSSDKNLARICFEGIEDEETFEFIKRYGESHCQGYYFAHPLLLGELREFSENAAGTEKTEEK